MLRFLIYGANGYTGELIAREAAARGHRPILAARRAESIAALARELNLETRVFALDEPRAVDDGLAGVSAVMHCAGPFSRTSRPMVDACLRARVAYLDVTGEVEVFETLFARAEEARQAGVLLLPGVGFDVVPSDCLAAHLKARLPSATHLTLAFKAAGRPSRGTATTVVENLHRGGLVRRDGRLLAIAPGSRTRAFDFGRGPRPAVCIPWGDVSTAYHSTGIPNVEVYMAAPASLRLGLRLAGPLRGLLRTDVVRGFLRRRVQAGPAGPSAEQRAHGSSIVVGEAADAQGRRVRARLRGPEGYAFTVATALRALERVLHGPARVGFATPSLAFGADFVLDVPGVVREDLPS